MDLPEAELSKGLRSNASLALLRSRKVRSKTEQGLTDGPKRICLDFGPKILELDFDIDSVQPNVAPSFKSPVAMRLRARILSKFHEVHEVAAPVCFFLMIIR